MSFYSSSSIVVQVSPILPFSLCHHICCQEQQITIKEEVSRGKLMMIVKGENRFSQSLHEMLAYNVSLLLSRQHEHRRHREARNFRSILKRCCYRMIQAVYLHRCPRSLGSSILLPSSSSSHDKLFSTTKLSRESSFFSSFYNFTYNKMGRRRRHNCNSK